MYLIVSKLEVLNSKYDLNPYICCVLYKASSNLGEKQDNLSKFDYLGNINDITGNIVCWVNSSNASGTMPCEGYFQLQQSCDGYNSIQHAFVYRDNNQPPYIYIRMHVNGGWTNWGKLIY